MPVQDEAPAVRLVNVRETARLLGISPVTAWRLVQRGELGSIKIGASRRVPLAEIDAYIARAVEARV